MRIGGNPIKSGHYFGYIGIKHCLVKKDEYMVVRLVGKMEQEVHFIHGIKIIGIHIQLRMF
jgi:hypothetical protein